MRSPCERRVTSTAAMRSHKAAIRFLQKQLPLIKEKLQTFTTEIYAQKK